MKRELWGVAMMVAAVATAAASEGRARRWLPRGEPVGERVAVEGGLVEGLRAGQAMAYRGIPYAAPPVGARRWTPPQPVPPWSGVRSAVSFAPPCPQTDSRGALIGDEDCLRLNLWTPAGTMTSSRLPVLFFIHGGGHVQGSASVQLADGTFLYDGGRLAAASQAVVVTAQYRLGALGFLAHPAFAAASPWGTAGNYGTLDLIAALQWVRRNVAAFGGDPRRVLVFGESAGAVETCMLLVSPLARGLFSAALMQSGGCKATSAAQAAQFAGEYAQAAGCAGASDVAACLKGLPVATVLATLPPEVSVVKPISGYGPVIDGVVIPAVPMDLIAAGQHARVPLVVGANRDETGTEAAVIVTEAQYQAAVLALANGNAVLAAALLNAYPVAEYGSPRLAFTALTSDANFICPARRIARAAREGQTAPVYRYFFTHPPDNASPAARALGAVHGMELFYLFQVLDALSYRPSPGELELASFIGVSWRQLAATGDPSPPGGPAWPRYRVEDDPFMELTTPPEAGAGVRTRQCDFWDSLQAWGAR